MNNQQLMILAAKGIFVWLVLSIAGFFAGEKLITLLIPFYETVIESASEGYLANIHIETVEHKENQIVLAATALKAKPITETRALPAGVTIESKITVVHALVPMVILFTIVFTWPAQSVLERFWLCVAAIPALLLVSALTGPLQLLGQLEIGFQNAAMNAGFIREQPLVLKWMLLTEGGGRWLIPALAGVACGGITNKLVRRKLTK